MIELVQKNKFLYDPRDPRYTKADIRVDTWAIIADHPTVKEDGMTGGKVKVDCSLNTEH